MQCRDVTEALFFPINNFYLFIFYETFAYNAVVEPFLCCKGVSAVDPFSHVILILQ